jgi:hypothetical protein
MRTSRRHPVNRRLAWERLERGWSHEELCQQLTRSMRETGEPDTGLTANTVRLGDRGALAGTSIPQVPGARVRDDGPPAGPPDG